MKEEILIIKKKMFRKYQLLLSKEPKYKSEYIN